MAGKVGGDEELHGYEGARWRPIQCGIAERRAPAVTAEDTGHAISEMPGTLEVAKLRVIGATWGEGAIHREMVMRGEPGIEVLFEFPEPRGWRRSAKPVELDQRAQVAFLECARAKVVRSYFVGHTIFPIVPS